MTIADLEAQLAKARGLGFDGNYEVKMRDNHGNSISINQEVIIQGSHPRAFILLVPEKEA